jgi:hypothetical protein
VSVSAFSVRDCGGKEGFSLVWLIGVAELDVIYF